MIFTIILQLLTYSLATIIPSVDFNELILDNAHKTFFQKVRNASIKADPIGSTAVSVRRHNKSLRRSLLARGNSQEVADTICLRELNSDQVYLNSLNQRLVEVS